MVKMYEMTEFMQYHLLDALFRQFDKMKVQAYASFPRTTSPSRLHFSYSKRCRRDIIFLHLLYQRNRNLFKDALCLFEIPAIKYVRYLRRIRCVPTGNMNHIIFKNNRILRRGSYFYRILFS